VTDAESLKIVTMVYAGLVNKAIVVQLQSYGCNAIGLTGADANLIPAIKRKKTDVDFGFVGDVEGIALQTAALKLFLENRLTPVMAPITHDTKGQLLNTNADTIASALAVALSKNFSVNLSYCFEKKGVLKNVEDEKSVMPTISEKDYEEMLSNGVVSQGIVPKLDNAFRAIKSGVKSVIIGHAENLRDMVYKNESTGTQLVIG
jgi:acetylglutamate kinase